MTTEHTPLSRSEAVTHAVEEIAREGTIFKRGLRKTGLPSAKKNGRGTGKNARRTR